ncbi:prospero homeobox protein 1-like isoform X1 [Ptychodera flava]|uniref:prospero homeobox protein 1-like isoform X1 n=1 Tax=Ptychodera flava TaxID=63121 RepID=UPI00396A3061
MAEVDDFSLRQSKRRRVDTGLPRNSYGQTQALSRAVNGNGVTEANQVLRRLLKPSNSQEGVNGDGDRLNGDDYVSSSILNKPKHNGDTEDSQSENENSMSFLNSELSTESQPRENVDLANKENGEDASRPQEENDDEDDDDEYTDRSIVNGASNSDNKCNENQSGNNNEKPEEESVLAKRARVENIVTSMRQSPSQLNSDGKNNQGNETRRQKRKQVAPQPQRVLFQEEKKEGRKEEKRQLKQLLTQLQDHLNKLQHKYFELYDNEETDSEMDEGLENEVLKFNRNGQNGSSKRSNGDGRTDAQVGQSSAEKKKKGNSEDKVQSNAEDAIINSGERGRFSDALKNQLTSAVTDVVDSVVRKFVNEQYNASQPSTQDEACNLTVAHENHNQSYTSKGNRTSPQVPYSKSSPAASQDSIYQSEQMEAISLVVPHKNRDRPSRESTPRVESQSHHDFEPPVPASLPTSVAIPNPSLQYSFLPHMSMSEAPGSIDMSSYSNGPLLHSQAAAILTAQADPRHHLHQGFGHREATHPQPEGLPLSLLKAEPMMGESSPISHDYSAMDNSGYNTPNNSCLSTTLTPAHLKKAKLMFFFARYPSSTVLKQHFPDVKFNRHNTAQLIKWFSNFREFYYIQMEKFARQNMSEGVKSPEMLQVSRDSELFKVLNLHYNKSNEFEVPDNFLVVARKTLIEFFNAIKAGKDTDASWKKAIYKIISKLDDHLPEFFRSPDCLEELERLER